MVQSLKAFVAHVIFTLRLTFSILEVVVGDAIQKSSKAELTQDVASYLSLLGGSRV